MPIIRLIDNLEVVRGLDLVPTDYEATVVVKHDSHRLAW